MSSSRQLWIYLCLLGLIVPMGTISAQMTVSGVQGSQALLDQIIAESQKHAFQRTTNPSHPLRVAEAAAAGMAGDLGDYNDVMVEVILRWARAGEFSEASYLAENLPASGPARAHLEIAGALLDHGKREEANQHLLKAAETFGQAHGRKAELIRKRKVQLLYGLDRTAEAKSMEGQLSALAQLELEVELMAMKIIPSLDLKAANQRLAVCEDRGVDRLRGAFLVACADRQLRDGNKAAGLTLLQEAGRVATRDGLPSAQHVLIDLAKTAHAGGEFKEADKAIRGYLEIIKSYAEAADWKAPSLADALDVLLDWKGREKTVKEWLKVGEAGLAKVFVLDAPRSALALARIAERVHGTQVGDRLVKQAAIAGRSHPHPRAQAAAAVMVCLYYADRQRDIPTDILQIINPQMEAAVK